jgi:O-antigen ligase
MVRLDMGLALVAFSAPFYLHPRPLLGKAFSMAEILTLLCLVSWGVRQIKQGRQVLKDAWSPSWADRAVLLLVVTAAASTLFAERRHVALRELRVAILEPALFYVMLRTTRLGEGGGRRRIIDGLVAGGAAVALIGLAQYAFGINIITAEGGFRRLRSIYGSPNNAALYLGRVLPILLAVAVLGRRRRRRIVYGLLALPVGLAILLSFSRAAILLGVPCALLALGLATGGRWRWLSLAVLLVVAVGTIPLLSTPRFRGLFNPQSGTLFFRLQLWRSSLKMVWDHPWLGVGPDNFLYAYRGRYILPSAWQEPHLSHAHNIVLTYLTRLGIVGLAAGLGLHATFWLTGLKGCCAAGDGDRALALGLVGSMAYTTAHGLVDASFFFPDLAFAFLLVLGLVQSRRR